MPEINSFSLMAGGAEITSYNLEYNQGSGGSTFYEVIGFTEEQLDKEIEVDTTPGVTYLFRYRVKNMFGFSLEFSPETEVKSAKAPEEPTGVVTEIVGHDLKIGWSPSDDNYDPITRFEIEILNKQGEWVQNTLTCDGADETIKTNNECLVPLLTLLSDDYQLEQGENI